MKRLITYALVFQMIALPLANARAESANAAAQATAAPKESVSMLRLVRDELSAHPKDYYVDAEMSAKQSLENKEISLQGIQELLNKLKDTSYSMESIRSEMIQQMVQEEEAQNTELKYVIRVMPSERLEELFQTALERGFYDPSLKLDFASAYTVQEKQDIVLNMIRTDLSLLKSANFKRLGLLDREDLTRELEVTQSLLSSKGDTWKVVLVVVLSVAAAGFLGWAVVGATKRHYEAKTRQADKDQVDRENKSKQEYANKEKELQDQMSERARLRDQGYVWQVCATTQNSKSVSCSYDYSTRSGTEVCVTHCLKNPKTGDAVQQTTSCTSAFIPNNCFVQNPYDAGYDKGNTDGYNDGYKNGYDKAYNDAYAQYYNKGYDKGYTNGYDRGYSAGYNDGVKGLSYNPGTNALAGGGTSSMSFLSASPAANSSTVDSVEQGFLKGYREGYAIAQQIKLGA